MSQTIPFKYEPADGMPLNKVAALVHQKRQFRYSFLFWFVFMHLAVIQGFFFFSWGAVLTAAVLYALCAVGLSAGYHRALAHGGFRASRPVMYALITLGALQLVGGPVSWIGMHHIHHKYSDTELDPHSSKRGFFWAHIGWAFVTTQDHYRAFTQKNIRSDPYYRFLDDHYVLPQLLLIVVLWLFGGWDYVVWGVFVRIIVHWHATFSVNSLAHFFGYKNYPDISEEDDSRNNWLVALFTLGEGWHNNHHFDKHAVYYGRKWWELDPTGAVILLLEKMRLVHRVQAQVE
jgi:fatty-acid desaturase